MKSNEEIEKELIGGLGSPEQNEEALVKMCLQDADPGRGATMLLGFAGGLAHRTGLTVEQAEAAVRAGYNIKTDPS